MPSVGKDRATGTADTNLRTTREEAGTPTEAVYEGGGGGAAKGEGAEQRAGRRAGGGVGGPAGKARGGVLKQDIRSLLTVKH